MVSPFDIYRVFKDGQLLWVEAALTLDDAMAQAKKLGASQSGEYLIHSQKTGVEVSMIVERLARVGPKLSNRSEQLTLRYRPERKPEM